MKITDAILTKFFGSGRGFTVQSIKRWGGFVKNEKVLEDTHYIAISRLISTRNNEKEFENELHMVNYMQRVCYWAWCEVIKRNLASDESLLILESDLVNEGDEDKAYSRMPEPSVEAVYPDGISAKALEIIDRELNPIAVDIARKCILGTDTPKGVCSRE